jgi:hypothetical protein
VMIKPGTGKKDEFFVHGHAHLSERGGVCDQLEQIARIVHEQGYWQPHERVQNYQRQDVYHLGKSAQSLFDDCAVLDRRVEQLHTRLGDIVEWDGDHHLPNADGGGQSSSRCKHRALKWPSVFF